MSEFGPEIQHEQEPFLIRTHHLALIRDVLHGCEPTSLGYEVYRVSENATSQETSIDNSYKVDVYGISESDKIKVIESDINFLQSFMELSDDYPIKLSTRKKDAICRSCIVGQHCNENVDPEENRDLVYHHGFISTARKLDLADKIMVITEAPDDESPTQEEIPTIITTAGIVSRVLPHKQFIRYLNNPEANQDKFSDYWYKLYPVRALAGVIAGYAAVSSVYNVGQAVQAYQDSEKVRSVEVRDTLEDDGNEDVEDFFKSAVMMTIAGTTYTFLPRRRKRS